MTVNLHTHTYRCGHATGTEEEYVLRAIQNGIKVMGFSEHVPYVFPKGEQISSHMPAEQAEEYVSSLQKLREKYKNDIEIHIGFEMEYFPLYFDDMYSFVKKLGAEYLLLAQHFVGKEEPWGHWIGKPAPMEDLTEYVDCVISGIKSGVFTYVCHPDLIRTTDDMMMYEREMTRLCVAAKEYDMPLEINFYGIRDHRFYPFDKFWEIAGRIGCKAVYGFDAHDVLSAFDGDSLPAAEEIVRKYGLTLIKEPKIVTLP